MNESLTLEELMEWHYREELDLLHPGSMVENIHEAARAALDAAIGEREHLKTKLAECEEKRLTLRRTILRGRQGNRKNVEEGRKMTKDATAAVLIALAILCFFLGVAVGKGQAAGRYRKDAVKLVSWPEIKQEIGKDARNGTD